MLTLFHAQRSGVNTQSNYPQSMSMKQGKRAGVLERLAMELWTKQRSSATILGVKRRYIFLLMITVPLAVAGSPTQRTVACKTKANAMQCYWTRGRLRYGNGTPALRFHKAGTNRVLGIFSGPSKYNARRHGDFAGDNEHPELPTILEKNGFGFTKSARGEFEVCPLERERAGYMQAACIQGARNISMEK